MQFGVSESIDHWAKYRPESVALYYNQSPINYREFDSLIREIAGRIIEDCGAEARIAIAFKSKFYLLAAIVAAIRSGKSAVILNTGLADDAIAINLQDVSTSALLCDGEFRRYERLLSTERPKLVIEISSQRSEPSLATTTSFSAGPEDEWGVLFSSGTTGPPKAISRDHNSMVTELIGWCLELNLSRHTTFYIGRPIYYTGGLVLALSTLLVGGRIVINDNQDENDMNEIWRDYQLSCQALHPTWAFFIPDQLRAFVRWCDPECDFAGANQILTMGGPISGEEKITANRLLKSNIVESWGNTESLGTITDPEDIAFRPGSIGRPFLTDEMYIVDENLNILGPYQEGRIAGGQEAGFREYCSRPESTYRTKRDGVILSEDIGYVDDDGYFYVRGRMQDNVIVNDRSVFLSDIEKKIRSDKAVRECCLVSLATLTGAVELVALVVPTDPNVSLRKLNSSLSKDEQLSKIIVAAEMPRLPSGKPDKLRVLQLAKDNE